jgi:hypothetical protein
VATIRPNLKPLSDFSWDELQHGRNITTNY